jgi:hypothetical protein
MVSLLYSRTRPVSGLQLVLTKIVLVMDGDANNETSSSEDQTKVNSQLGVVAFAF